MSPTLTWSNEAKIGTTAELLTWLLDQDVAANEWAKPKTARLTRLDVETVTIATTLGPADDPKWYEVSISYEVNK
jgi:hypothetical protein